MGFQFSISGFGRLPTAGITFVEGFLEDGTIRSGDMAIIRNAPNHYIRIKSVALVDSDPPDPKRLTLSVEEPAFPLSVLDGKVLIGVSPSQPDRQPESARNSS